MLLEATVEYRPFDVFTFPVSLSLDVGNAFPRISILSSLSSPSGLAVMAAFTNPWLPVSRESEVSAWLDVVRSNFPMDFVSPVVRSVLEDHAKVVRPPFLASCVSHSDSSSRVASAAAPVTETLTTRPNLVTWITHICFAYLYQRYSISLHRFLVARLISRGAGTGLEFFHVPEIYALLSSSSTYLVN